MEKLKLTKEETVEQLKILFDYKNNEENKNVMISEHEDKNQTIFMINKMYLERYEVIDKLQKFFANHSIIDGRCRVDSMTFVYTIFFIEDNVSN